MSIDAIQYILVEWDFYHFVPIGYKINTKYVTHMHIQFYKYFMYFNSFYFWIIDVVKNKRTNFYFWYIAL